jgi:hypothetical protein
MASAHLQRVAHRGPSTWFMSVTSARGLQARAAGHRDDAVRQLLRHGRRVGKGAVAHLDVHHQPLQAGGQLLGQDAGGDQRHDLDRGGDIADGVEALVGGRQVAVWPMMAQPTLRARTRSNRAASGVASVAGHGRQLVQRAAGVAQAAAGIIGT